MTAPKRCHPYDADRARRMAGSRHAGPCADCEPCDQRHCGVCGWRHVDDQHPQTCAECVPAVREDLDVIAQLHEALPVEAQHHPTDTAPGSTRLDVMGRQAMALNVARHWRPAERQELRAGAGDVRGGEHGWDSLDTDPIPPLLILAGWEDDWRKKLQTPTRDRATVAGACAYLDKQLTLMAQSHGAFVEFVRDIRRLRSQLEDVLADGVRCVEGVECFECGTSLVRRYRDPRPCPHARGLAERIARDCRRPVLSCEDPACWGCRDRRMAEDTRVRQAIRVELAEHHCPQGGIDDPRPGFAWECPVCRRRYSPGEYVRAVRADLLDSGEANAWADITTAADAASVIVGRPIPTSTVRTWMSRGLVGVGCAWSQGVRMGRRVVAWLDVAEQASERRSHDTRGGAA